MKRVVSVLLLAYMLASPAYAADYNLAVQPVMTESDIQTAYQPLADYLSKVTGETFHVMTHKNFLTYWIRMRKGKGFDFVLDAAHFTDYRLQKNDYRVLAKFPDTVSFSVITGSDSFVFDMEELISKRIATMPSPGLGAIRLYDYFPNPIRLPAYVQADNSSEAGEMLLKGEVDAAIIPTPLVSSFDGVNTVISTEPVPHMALSASMSLPKELVDRVEQALVDAENTPEGRKMLEEIGIERFEKTSAEDYQGYGKLLEAVFGY